MAINSLCFRIARRKDLVNQNLFVNKAKALHKPLIEMSLAFSQDSY